MPKVPSPTRLSFSNSVTARHEPRTASPRTVSGSSDPSPRRFTTAAEMDAGGGDEDPPDIFRLRSEEAAIDEQGVKKKTVEPPSDKLRLPSSKAGAACFCLALFSDG
jgi:hypothetical protein